MGIIDLKMKLRSALAERNQKAIHYAFCEFERAGGLQADAMELGEKLHLEILDTDDELNDILIDILDLVWGWCSPHNRIWKD